MIHVRQLQSSLHVRDGGDGRTLVGPLLPWGVEARVVDQGRLVVETFARGALEGTDPARVPLTATHPRDAGTLPIGVMVEFEERADAAHGAWHVSDTMIGNEVLALARDGVPLGLSVGFAEGPGGSRWSADRQRVVRTRAALDYVAVVRVPAYQGAGVVGVRWRVSPATPRCSSPCSVAAVARGSKLGGMRNAGAYPGSGSRGEQRCLSCKRRIAWGERCESCKQELRQRQRRKPR
jgi:phage head maturation protease